MTTSEQKGLLLVTMQPPAELEEEFNDWYDTEHIPQRQNYPGFKSAVRWVCIDGWPRWLATYDMTSTEAVQTPEYLATNGPNTSPWTSRIVSRISGRRRVVAAQIAPGNEPSLPQASISRLLVARFASDSLTPPKADAKAPTSRPAQVRYFRAPGETWLLAAFGRPVVLGELTAAWGGLDSCGADFFNLYVPYRRS